LALLQEYDTDTLGRLGLEIIGVADPNPEAPGIQKAKRKDLFTTSDFHDLYSLKGLNIILELTDDQQLIRDLVAGKPTSVGLIDHNAFSFFREILSLGQHLDQREDEFSLLSSLARSLTEATREAIMVLDLNYRIIQINEGACRQAGITADEAKNRFCFQITHQSLTPCRSLETPCPMVETVVTGKSAHAIHEHIDASGNVHFCDVTTFPVVNQRGEVIQVLEIFKDITQELSLRLEERTRAIKNDLARLVQEDKLIALGKLVASVAHEINNPLGSILNFNKLILKTLQDHRPSSEDLKDFKKWLDLSVREAQRSAIIIGNLLSFARQRNIEPRKVAMQEILDQIILLIGHRLDLSKITLISRGFLKEPLTFWGDPTQIQQCLMNLIFNSLEAMPQGGTLTIRGGQHHKKKEIRIEITDTGPGISSENMPHIFEPFFSTKKELQGVGLGLSMVYGIITEHGGRIEVESPPGQGATFRIFLPSTSPEKERQKGADCEP